ncbi:hypothetical protein JCM13580A_38480 [Streptomyces drozdowiczii]|uniref:hypothetical protein n=1 Tax=Streptomyces drozdowiczii TaxID=202862 RepID=UPI0031EBAC53
MNQPNEKLTTAQAAKLLGVRTDTIHVMKAEGHLTVVGRGHHGTNLFALADVQQLKVKRLKAQRDVPVQQAKLPNEDDLVCDSCRALHVRLLAEQEKRLEAEAQLQAEKGRASRALASLTAAIG